MPKRKIGNHIVETDAKAWVTADREYTLDELRLWHGRLHDDFDRWIGSQEFRDFSLRYQGVFVQNPELMEQFNAWCKEHYDG